MQSLRGDRDKKTYVWTFRESDVDIYRELNKYKEATKHWRLHFDYGVVEGSSTLSDIYIQKNYGRDDSEYQRLGTAPVRNAYWATVIGKEAYGQVPLQAEFGSEQPVRLMTSFIPEEVTISCPKLLSHPIPETIKKLFGKEPERNPSTVVFRRFPRLELSDHIGIPEDILVKALLGLLDDIGYKFAQGAAILDDSWQVNLRENKKVDLMLDMFLRGFDGKSEELKKLWENKMMVDVNEELKDLLKVYKDAAEHLQKHEGYRLTSLVSAMKDFIKVHEESKEMQRKLATLVQKLDPNKQNECDEDDE